MPRKLVLGKFNNTGLQATGGREEPHLQGPLPTTQHVLGTPHLSVSEWTSTVYSSTDKHGQFFPNLKALPYHWDGPTTTGLARDSVCTCKEGGPDWVGKMAIRLIPQAT